MSAQRELNAWTLAVILVMPAMFGWLILRKGYRNSLRRTVLSYAVVMTTVGALGRLTQ